MKIIPYDDYNHQLHIGGIIGTVRQTFGMDAWRNGWKIIEVYDDDIRQKSLKKFGDLS